MYARCHLCDRSLGTNSLAPHMPIGRRLAFDPGRGRLWVVCRRCGEWNLTPIEERWEAIEECERLFAGAPVRTSTGNVGLARLSGIELIRVGTAMRDELANWRYLPRLRLRRRMAAIRTTMMGVVGGGVLGGAVLLGISSGSVSATLWLTALGAIWGTWVAHLARARRGVRFRDGRGGRHLLGSDVIPAITLTRRRVGRYRGGSNQVGIHIAVGRDESHFGGGDAVLVLAAVLPRLNWLGGSEAQLARAMRLVDDAEERESAAGHTDATSKPAWSVIALGNWPADDRLENMGSDARLALEMSVTEALERRELKRAANPFLEPSKSAEEVAAIADDMFVPKQVTDWIDRLRTGMRAGGRS